MKCWLSTQVSQPKIDQLLVISLVVSALLKIKLKSTECTEFTHLQPTSTVSLPVIDQIKVEKNGFSKLMQMSLIFHDKNQKGMQINKPNK